MNEEQKPTLFLGKARIMEAFNGNPKPYIKVIVIGIMLLATIILAVSANWGAIFRESGVSAEMLRANVERIERNETELRSIRTEFLTKEAYQSSQQEILRRMDLLERSNQQIIQMIVEDRRGKR